MSLVSYKGIIRENVWAKWCTEDMPLRLCDDERSISEAIIIIFLYICFHKYIFNNFIALNSAVNNLLDIQVLPSISLC
jgi:hypothetical protein